MHRPSLTLAWATLGLAASFAASVPAHSAEDCLSGPKTTTPAGQHWYYRIDRATKKQCWYLADHGARINKSAAAKPSAAVAGTEDAQPAPLEDSVANARAEVSSTSILSSSSATTVDAAAPLQAEPGADASPSNEATRRLTEHDLITQAPTTLASRLPLPNEFQPVEPRADETAPIAIATRSEQARQPSAARGADAHIGPMQILLCAIGLALAAILGRVIFQYVAGARRKRTAQTRRRQIWPDDISDSIGQPSYAQMITPKRRARVEEDVTEIEQLLRSGARRSR